MELEPQTEYLCGAVLNFLHDGHSPDTPQHVGREKFPLSSSLQDSNIIYAAGPSAIEVLHVSVVVLSLLRFYEIDDFVVAFSTNHQRVIPVRCVLSPEARQGNFASFITSIRESFERALALFSGATPLPLGQPAILIQMMSSTTGDPLVIDKDPVSYKMSIMFYAGQSPHIDICYKSSAISQGTVHGIGTQIEYIIENIRSKKSSELQPLLTVCALPEREQQRLVRLSCGQKKRFPNQHESVVAAFDRMVEEHPSAVAVNFDGRKCTYTELRSLAASILPALVQATSVAVGDKQPVILIFAPRSTELIAALLAALCLRAVYVPVDASTPVERCKVIAEDSGACALLTDQASWAAKFQPWWAKPFVFIDAPHQRVQPSPPAAPEVISKAPGASNFRAAAHAWLSAAAKDDLAPSIWEENLKNASSCGIGKLFNIIYTSGSTGKPKGVAVPECSILNNVRDYIAFAGLTASSVSLASFSIGFDPHTLVMLAPLMCGGTVLLAPDDIHRDSEALLRLLDQATLAFFTPSGWALVLASAWEGNRNLVAWTGGEALSLEMVNQLGPRVKRLINAWGPTEAAILTTYDDVSLQEDGPVSIGRPNANNRLYVVDENMNLLPPGASGEICLAGPALARGYLNLPERTSAAFVPDPFIRFIEVDAPTADVHEQFHRTGDGRLYRTGDRGSWGEDMRVYCHGRIDNQVKIRGYRIELTEIEQQLLQLPEATAAGISFAIVQPYNDPTLGMCLAAYLKLDPLLVAPSSPRSPRSQLPAMGSSSGELALSRARSATLRGKNRGVQSRDQINQSRVEASQQMGNLLRPRGPLTISNNRLQQQDTQAQQIQQGLLTRTLRTALSEKLPPYMIPTHFQLINEIPLSRNGKVDTGALPKPDIAKRSTFIRPMEQIQHPPTSVHARVAELVGKVLGFPLEGQSGDVNFFTELGVTSIIAIRLTEALNAEWEYANVNVAMLYALPTINDLATYLGKAESNDAGDGGMKRRPSSVLLANDSGGPQRASFLWDVWWSVCCFVGVTLIIYLMVLPSWPAIKFSTWILREYGLLCGLLSVPGAYLGYSLLLCLEMLLLKWILIGRYRTGEIHARSFAFWRWWVVDRFHEMGEKLFIKYLVGTPWMNLWLKMLGATVDMYSHIETAEIREYDLVEIGPRSTINFNAALLPHAWEGETQGRRAVLQLGRIRLAPQSWVGNRALVPLSKSGEKCSYVPASSDEDTQRPQHRPTPKISRYNACDIAVWLPLTAAGIALTACMRVAAYYPVFLASRWIAGRIADSFLSDGASTKTWNVILAYVATLQSFDMIPFLPVLVERQAVEAIGRIRYQLLVVIAFIPITTVLTSLAVLTVLVLVKWLVLWRLSPGKYHRGSLTHFRFWLYGLVLRNVSAEMQLYDDTWFMMALWRLLGARTTFSNWMNELRLYAPDLCHFGKRAAVGATGHVLPFFFDGDTLNFVKCKVPKGALVGMRATLTGQSLPVGCTLGVLSGLDSHRVVPAESALVVGEAAFPAKSAHEMDGPNWWRVRYSVFRNVRYAVYMLLYILVSPVLVMAVQAVALAPAGWLMIFLRRRIGFPALALIPVAYYSYTIVALIAALILKWMLYGRLQNEIWEDPDSMLLHYRRLFTVALYEVNIVRLIGGRAWLGSPVWNWIANLLGARISNSAIVLTTDLYDLDLIRIGPGSVLDRGAVISPHTRERDVCVFQLVTLGTGCVVGANSVCMYDVVLLDGAELRPMSLAVPRQRLDGIYRGVPSILLKRRQRKAVSSRSATSSVAKLLTPLDLPQQV